MPRRFFHCLCVLLLLIAQQGALSHASWHAGGGAQGPAGDSGHTYEADSQPEAPRGQQYLCAFDMAFGQVLGGTHNAGMPTALVLPVSASIHDLAAPRPRAAALSPKSRGPPVLA